MNPLSHPMTAGEGPGVTLQLKGKHKEERQVLDIITLHVIDMLERDSLTGRCWVAVFLERS